MARSRLGTTSSSIMHDELDGALRPSGFSPSQSRSSYSATAGAPLAFVTFDKVRVPALSNTLGKESNVRKGVSVAGMLSDVKQECCQRHGR